jgi:hypothetical protein
MQVFNPNYTIIDGIRPKVIETAKGFLLNTQYYDKAALSPVPFESLSILGSSYVLNIYRHMFLETYSWNRNDNNLGIIQDKNIPNRYYFKIINGYKHGTRQEFLVCVEEQNGEITYVANTNVNDCQIVEYVDQDDTYLYFMADANMVSRLCRYNKSTFAFELLIELKTGTYGYRSPKKVFCNDTYIYFFTQNGMNLHFYQYNKITKASFYTKAIYRGQDTVATNYNYSMKYDSVVDLGNGKYGIYAYNVGNQEQPLDLYIIDTTTPITANDNTTAASMQHVNIAWNGDKTSIPYLATPTSVNTIYRTSVLEINGVRYLNVYVYNKNNENVAYVATQGVYTFLINSDTELTFTGFNQVDATAQFTGILESENKRHLLVAKNKAFKILKFDTNTKRYEDGGMEITSCCSVGFDELQRIWYEKDDTSVEIINLEDAQSVQIKFEKTHYEYSGAMINTFIEFSALNYLNEEMKGTFQLTLSGSAVFTENNTNELTFEYDGLGIKQIGISINGANPITVYPKYIS